MSPQTATRRPPPDPDATTPLGGAPLESVPTGIEVPAPMLRRPGTWLAILLIALGAFRLIQAGSGRFFFADELRYLAAEAMVDDLAAGRMREAGARLFEAQGRPGFVAVSAIPVALQRIAELTLGIARGSRASYDVAAAWNIAVSLAVTLLVYLLARRWLGSGWTALAAAMLHASLVGSSLWVRHLSPYYEALLLMLLALMLALRDGPAGGRSNRAACAAGLLSAAGFACYPGYYAFIIVVAAVLAVPPGRRVGRMLAFGASAAAGLIALEVSARWCGTSYWGNLATLSGSIHFGSPEENAVYFWRYLSAVDGPIGVALVLLVILFAAQSVRRSAADERGHPASLRIAFAALVCGYALHAAQSIRTYPTVFYGRLLLMYTPVACIAAVAAIRLLPSMHLRRISAGGVAASAIASFASFAAWYARVGYPADLFLDAVAARGVHAGLPAHVLWSSLGTDRDRRVEHGRLLFAHVADQCPEGFTTILATHEDAVERNARFIGVNLKWMRDVPAGITPFEPPADYHLIAEADDPATEPAYMFEERGPIERERLLRSGRTMRLYERAEAREAVNTRIAHGGT